MRFQCPKCDYQTWLSDGVVGRRIKCPACHRRVKVAAPDVPRDVPADGPIDTATDATGDAADETGDATVVDPGPPTPEPKPVAGPTPTPVRGNKDRLDRFFDAIGLGQPPPSGGTDVPRPNGPSPTSADRVVPPPPDLTIEKWQDAIGHQRLRARMWSRAFTCAAILLPCIIVPAALCEAAGFSIGWVVLFAMLSLVLLGEVICCVVWSSPLASRRHGLLWLVALLALGVPLMVVGIGCLKQTPASMLLMLLPLGIMWEVRASLFEHAAYASVLGPPPPGDWVAYLDRAYWQLRLGWHFELPPDVIRVGSTPVKLGPGVAFRLRRDRVPTAIPGIMRSEYMLVVVRQSRMDLSPEGKIAPDRPLDVSVRLDADRITGRMPYDDYQRYLRWRTGRSRT